MNIVYTHRESCHQKENDRIARFTNYLGSALSISICKIESSISAIGIKIVMITILFINFGMDARAQTQHKDDNGAGGMQYYSVQYTNNTNYSGPSEEVKEKVPKDPIGYSGIDEYGYYINLYIRAATRGGGGNRTHLYVNRGSVLVETRDGARQEIFQFWGNPWSSGGPNNTAVNVKPTITGVKLKAFNGDNVINNSWSDFVPAGNVVTKFDGGADIKEGFVRWYVPQYLMQQDFRIYSDYNVLGTNGINYPYMGYPLDANGYEIDPNDWGPSSAHYNITVENPAVNSVAFSYSPSSNPGKMTLKYAYSDSVGIFNHNRYSVKHYIDDNATDLSIDNSNWAPSGTLEVDMNNTNITHQFKTIFTGKDGIFSYTSSQDVDVPAYVWPSAVMADYDGRDSVKVSWDANIYNLGNGYIKNDNFEVQRSTDPTFATHTTTVGSYPYDPNLSHYVMFDNLKNLEGGTQVYYRVRRTKTSFDWEWAKAAVNNIQIFINSILNVKKVILSENNNTPTGTITWEPFRGVWTNGTKFTIKKTNKTSNTLAASFDLTEDQARSGMYIDENITYCNEFTYSIQLSLGNNYPSPPEAQVAGSILAVNIGTISDFTASKGYFPDRVDLMWHSQGVFDNYIVKRKIYGSTDNFVQIANLPGSNASDYQTEDAKGAPGVYYQYIVFGAVGCNNDTKYSKDTLQVVGFRAPTGEVYGRVTYENGQAVEGVAVRMQGNNDTQLGKSIYLNGTPGSYLKSNVLKTPIEDSAFSVSAWIKPDDASPRNQVIFVHGKQYELGFDGEGKLYFKYNSRPVESIVTGNYQNENNAFVHVAGIHRGGMLMLMINDSVINQVAINYRPSFVNDDVPIYIGAGQGGTSNYFKGFIDEMNLWNIALSKEWMAQNYTRLLDGGESGLVAYWRFDETISNEFYDISHLNTQYNRNDGVMDANSVVRSNVIPSLGQLSLKGFTDSTGNYMITGIPYTGNGTSYSIAPLFQTHQFDPISVNRMISSNSSSFNIDFKDNSSFPVSGTVYYRNSTVPVEGVQFKIDGRFVLESNGNLNESQSDGKFTISVPVGYHEVQLVKNNHVFENNGRIIMLDGSNRNYQGPVSELKLYDSTTIRFIGRVAGGAVQESYPLGHSLSTNNLGEQLSITLHLTNPAYQIATTDSAVVVDHLLPSNQSDSSRIHHTRVVYNPDKIIIYPDSLTGEFAADLIPEKFTVDDVEATGWGNILGNNNGGAAQVIDFTQKFLVQSVVHNYKDSVQNNLGEWVYKDYSDKIFYNDSYQFIKRVVPTFSFTQVSNNGKLLDFYGDSVYLFHSLSGKNYTIHMIDRTKMGLDKYLFSGHPVFTQGIPYSFKLKAFERYPFHKINGQLGLVDSVATSDGSITIYNGIEGSVIPDTLSLDSMGIANYKFVAGGPNIIEGLKNLSVNVKFGSAENVGWKFGSEEVMPALVLGSEKIGTDFVTAGPNKMLMVLRDPPGNHSYSYAEKGSTISTSTSFSGSTDFSNDMEAVAHLGTKIITWEGIGAGVIQEEEAIVDIGAHAHVETHFIDNKTKVMATTFTSRFQTSDDPGFVGAPADLFVGYSTNITYGESNNLIVIKNDEIESTDKVIVGLQTDSYSVVERGGINLGEKFGTLFAYPQQHIEEVLIPNLIHLRDHFLLPMNFTGGQDLANALDSIIYVSNLPSDDPRFGKSNNDPIFGAAGKGKPFDKGPSYSIFFPAGTSYRTDTIMVLNQYVSQWQEELKRNEKEKLESKLFQNYSFHAGNPIEYSEKVNSGEAHNKSFNIILSQGIDSKQGDEILGIGFEVSENESFGSEQEVDEEHSEETEVINGFQLAAGGLGEYISVDVNKAKDGGFVFRTKGGQTECPYEGGSMTKYYQPGTQLDQPTVQMDKPQISVDKAIVNGVPSARPAVFTLSLNNASDAQWSTDYELSYGSVESIQGALLSVDGASIAGGRTYPINFGQTLTKVLTLKKGPDAMDYDNIPIILNSACQYDPTGYQQTIADTVFISAHFIPSCTDIHIKSPSDKWILNTESPRNDEGIYIPTVLDQFDVNNKFFDHIELQYKSSSESDWKTMTKFYADQAKLDAAQGGEKELISDPEEINYNMVLNDGSFIDHGYDIRAVSFCVLGPGNIVTTESNIVSGIKDTYTPRLFGSPQPADGILGIGDEIRLNFNEPIDAGRLTAADFQVTGIRNGSRGDHSVSVQLDGQNDFLATEFDKNMGGKNITAEMWILPDDLRDETVYSQGNINESMELSLTADGYLLAIVGKHAAKSDRPVEYKNGQWAHVAISYNAVAGTVSAFYNFEEVISNVAVGGYNGKGNFEFGRSISKQGNLFKGKIHEVRIWSKVLTGQELQINSMTRFSGSEEGLLGYYPLNEGKGTVALDKAGGAHAQIIGNWSTPDGRSFQYDGNGYIRMNTSFAPVTASMDYTIGLWFKAEPSQQDATLISNGKADGSEAQKNLFCLGFENGLLTFHDDGVTLGAAGNYLDNNWHHVAVSVNRNSAIAQIFVDGALKNYTDAANIGGLESSFTYLGVRAWYAKDDILTVHYDQYFKGKIDEVRIWNTYLNQTLINKNNNVRLKGDEIGLLVYYPFEKYYENQNNMELDTTLNDMKIQDGTNPPILYAEAVNAVESDDKAPIIDRGPIENLKFDYVVNNDALIINMQEEPRNRIDKTIITFKVKDVRDENNNELVSPITWSAYIDQNQLKWSDNQLNLSKDLYSPMEFTSDVINRGGSVQHFRLDNLPPWLIASPISGTVNPESSQKIVFTVNEGLNVGSYNEVVNMVNDNNESEALTLNMLVRGKSPKWSVNPSDFKYNMTIYGKIRINGIFSSDKEDILAAFSNGKCVGVAHNTYFAGRDFWYTFLTVYGDSLKSENLEFRIWDAGDGKTYEGLPSQKISFVNDGIIGSSAQPIIFDASGNQYQDIELNGGWNWISFNLNNSNLNIVPSALANGTWHSGDIIKNNESGFDQFSGTQGWIGTLSRLDNLSLFMLNTDISQTLSMKGKPVDLKNTPIHIKGGSWNYISYLPLVSMPVKDALAGYDASDEDVIKSQSGFSMYDSQNGWVGNLTILRPGEGYMLYRKSGSDVSFVYPQISGSLIPRRIGIDNSLQIPVSSRLTYQGNMTMIGAAEDSFTLRPDDRVLAFVSGELRGKAVPINNPLTQKTSFFLNIAGADQNPVIFKVERNGKIIAQSSTFVNYRLNGAPGTLKKPVILYFSKNDEGTGTLIKEISISPNSFRQKVRIKIKLRNQLSMEVHKVQISVVDMMGRTVISQPKDVIRNGYYEASWNGRYADNRECTKGVYFIRISIDGIASTYKVLKE